MLWLVVAALAVTADHEAIVRIQQTTEERVFDTAGAVVYAGPVGTVILTCRHGRSAQLPWKAWHDSRAVLRGRHVAIDPHSDLAVLWTPKRWPGAVLEVSDGPPDLGVMFVDTGRRTPWPFGQPVYALEEPPLSEGESGRPLLWRGKVGGVYLGSAAGCQTYSRQDEIVRFLGSKFQWAEAKE